MRRLGSVLGTGRWQGYLMGFSFLASGAMVARWVTGQLAYCWGLCYVPWLLYHAVRTEEPCQGRRLAHYAGCLALQFLCGHPQAFWFSAIGQGAFIVTSTLRLPLREAMRDAWHRLWQFGVACVWCSGLVAIVLLPMLELVHESNRAQSTGAFANSYNMTWTDLGYLFLPRWGGILWENNLLVGGAMVVAGVLGLCRVREAKVRGLLGMLVIGLLIALGENTPFFGLFYRWLPGYAGFRFQGRAAMLVVVALICAGGIWLSRPHPRLRAVWSYLFGIPVRWFLLPLVVVQVLDLLQGAWMTKRFVTPTCCLAMGIPLESSAEWSLVEALQEQGLIKSAMPPPRVCVPPSVVPANYGMIHHYSSFDANCSLFLRRPWDYLHAMLGITPPIEKGSLAPQVYDHAPFPYRDLSIAAGKQPQEHRLVVANPPQSPRAFLVYEAQNADYRTVLDRLARGQDIRQCALVESPLAEPLLPANRLAAQPAVIRQFEPNGLLVDVDASTNALLVLAEAWYPGWEAEIDGRPGACLPANTWMRSVAVRAGQHQVRLRFRQNYLLPGFLISLASVGLLVLVAARRRHPMPSPLEEPIGALMPAQPRAGGKPLPKRPLRPVSKGARSLPWYRRLLRVLAFIVVLAFAGLLISAESSQVLWFRGKVAGVDATAQCRIGAALLEQRREAEAQVRFKEAVRLAERACRLTDGEDPLEFATLAGAYAATGSLDKAIDAARFGHRLAVAQGLEPLANALQGQMDRFNAARKAPAGDQK